MYDSADDSTGKPGSEQVYAPYGLRKDGTPAKRRGCKPGRKHSGQFKKVDVRRFKIPKGQSYASTSVPALARSFGPEALTTLMGIVRNPEAQNRDKINAAQHILNRGYGVAPQKIDIGLESRYQKLLDDGVPFADWDTDSLMALALDVGTKHKGRSMPPELFDAVQAALGFTAGRAGVLIEHDSGHYEPQPGQGYQSRPETAGAQNPPAVADQADQDDAEPSGQPERTLEW